MIEASYTLTENEFVEAQAILIRVVQKQFMRMRIWLSCVFVLVLLEPVITRTATWHIYTSGGVLFVCILLLMMVFYPSIQAHAARKQFRKVRDAFTNLHIRLDETGYTGDSPLSNGHMKWAAFTGWREGTTVLTLIRQNLMYPLPKRAFTSAQLVEVRELYRTYIPGK